MSDVEKKGRGRSAGRKPIDDPQEKIVVDVKDSPEVKKRGRPGAKLTKESNESTEEDEGDNEEVEVKKGRGRPASGNAAPKVPKPTPPKRGRGRPPKTKRKFQNQK